MTWDKIDFQAERLKAAINSARSVTWALRSPLSSASSACPALKLPLLPERPLETEKSKAPLPGSRRRTQLLSREAFAALRRQGQGRQSPGDPPFADSVFCAPSNAAAVEDVSVRSFAAPSSAQGLLCLCLQGSGPHFCPGGNPSARSRGESPFHSAPFAMFLAILRLQELDVISAALQGIVLGGGLAMALLVDFRVVDSSASLSLGNLSRGMVPCMLLSSHCT